VQSAEIRSVLIVVSASRSAEQLKEQAAQIQKVSAHVELSKPEPQIVLNNH
jgi:hypothetical protein